MLKNFIINLIFLSFFFNVIHNSLISDQKIYKNLQNEFICFRRFNGTHQFGCQSKHSGSVGTVHLVNTDSDIDVITKTGNNHPYIPCLRSKFFTYENLIKFKNSDRVTGLVLFDVQSTDKLPESLTEDNRCPNDVSSFYVNDQTYGHCKKGDWNVLAGKESFLDLNLDFPMILIRDKDNITNIEKCFYEFNQRSNSDPPSKIVNLLCSLQLETWMIGAKNSKTCISRSASSSNFEATSFCDSVSSYNVFSNLFKYEKNDKIKDRSVVMLTSKIDSLSIFNNAANGVSTTLSSLIVLFSTMNILRNQKGKTLSPEHGNVMYSLFDGEALDYVGSGRMAYDLGTDGIQPNYPGVNSDFRFLKKHIRSAIDLNQLISENKFYLHSDPLTRNKPAVRPELDKLVKSLTSDGQIEYYPDDDLPLPPSSIQQLLAHDLDLPVLVISNHRKGYSNRFYNSFLDDSRTVKNKQKVIKKMASLSELVAKSVVLTLNENAKNVDVKADLKLIEKLYDCFIEDSRCALLEDLRGQAFRLDPQYKTFSLYISTTGSSSYDATHYRYVTSLGRLSTYLTAKSMDKITTKDECDQLNKLKNNNAFYEWVDVREEPNNKSYCFESTQFYKPARSPIFLSDPPNWSLNYSTWTESVWNSPDVKLFVSSSKIQEYSTFITGLIIFLSSYFLSHWVHKNSSTLFVEIRLDNNVAVSM